MVSLGRHSQSFTMSWEAADDPTYPPPPVYNNEFPNEDVDKMKPAPKKGQHQPHHQEKGQHHPHEGHTIRFCRLHREETSNLSCMQTKNYPKKKIWVRHLHREKRFLTSNQSCVQTSNYQKKKTGTYQI